jgi:hypothetical protein
MPWLVQPDLPPTRESEPRHRAPSGFLHVRATNTLVQECRHLGPEVITHEIQLDPALVVGRVNGQLGRRQCEDQPIVTCNDRWTLGSSRTKVQSACASLL